MTWLRESMTESFFNAMAGEPEALAILEREIDTLKTNQNLILADRPETLILATRSLPGSLYQGLTQSAKVGRPISYAMFAHSSTHMPGMEQSLEIQRFAFECKSDSEIQAGLAAGVTIPDAVKAPVRALLASDAGFNLAEFDRLLAILWLNHAGYLRVSSPARVAEALRMLHLCETQNGLYFDLTPVAAGANEARLLFAIANPPHTGYVAQVVEILHRFDVGIRSADVLDVSTGAQPYALFAMSVRQRKGQIQETAAFLRDRLRSELFNTQILTASSTEYRDFVTTGQMSGDDASLTRAFVAFCHTQLAHAQPDRYDWKEVQGAIHANTPMLAQFVALFRLRFDPAAAEGRDAAYADLRAKVVKAVEDYDTGHAHLDAIRRVVFHCCLSFIDRTLKTNFFVKEKQALAFRLDPAYLADLGQVSTADLPSGTPFRVTFFFGGHAFGYHIGFSDIARGGWRTVICRTQDDFLTNASTLFKESFVLAHTQHLKNKDIYEGGSKLVVLLDAAPFSKEPRSVLDRLLRKKQRDVFSAFLDIFVTENGIAKHPAVVDYYRQDEPIEIGPDENMHDDMIEEIALTSKRRGYILGTGVMSSKTIGINHKEYGVTSTGVVKFAEIAMHEIGIDITRDAFTVKFTGGPNGDVAGNAMQIMLDLCPKMEIRLILDGTAALSDPAGADAKELRRILLAQDLDGFNPEAMHVGGFMLFRGSPKEDGMRKLYRKVTRTAKGLVEEWISIDDLSRQFGDLPFSVPADLFIPGGGRPETINDENWQRFLLPDGAPSSKVIVEGANSFITPAARLELQKKGVLLMRDASANKCGVISSSYEIIANLLLTEEEFLANKPQYVKDVLSILKRRAEDEARLLVRRHAESKKPWTEISNDISVEINMGYKRLFEFFQQNPAIAQQEFYDKVILSHLPALLREDARFNRRFKNLSPKYRAAILAAEIGSSMVYQANQEAEFEDSIRRHVERRFR
jgi:glutamate dehydrogenase